MSIFSHETVHNFLNHSFILGFLGHYQFLIMILLGSGGDINVVLFFFAVLKGLFILYLVIKLHISSDATSDCTRINQK